MNEWEADETRWGGKSFSDFVQVSYPSFLLLTSSCPCLPVCPMSEPTEPIDTRTVVGLVVTTAGDDKNFLHAELIWTDR